MQPMQNQRQHQKSKGDRVKLATALAASFVLFALTVAWVALCIFHLFHPLTMFGEKPLHYGAMIVGLLIGSFLNEKIWGSFREDYILQEVQRPRQHHKPKVKA